MDSVRHFEIPFDNEERAASFYKKVFGWNIVPMPKMNYVMVHTAKTDKKGMLQEKGAINGGMMKRGDEIKSPVITVVVKNLDKTLASIEKNGGMQILERMKVEKMGVAAYFKDSEGNVMGLFEPSEEMM